MHSKDLAQDNLAKIQAAFPNCITESTDENGNIKLSVDFDLLRQELSDHIVEGPQERYRLDWPGKREAILLANAPIAKTLRPARDESVDFDNTENLFIEGDNLEALKLLQENYLGKVKMIYIDPPYNTGNDFVYKDNFAESSKEYFERSNQIDEEGNRLVTNTNSNGRFHSDWLSMMLSRLRLARNLLADDGVIFISIDDSEQANLKRLCDEVFGEENIINIISIYSKASSGASGGGEDKRLKKNIEYLVFYCKDINQFKLNIPQVKMDLMKYIDERLEEGRTFAYNSVLVNQGDLVFFKKIKDGAGNDIELFEVDGFVIKTINQVMRDENLSREEVYYKYFDSIFTTENAQTSIRTRVDKATNDSKFYIARYKPVSGRNKGLLTDVGFIGNTKRLVSFLKNVAYKEGENLYKTEKIGTLWDDLSWSSVHLEGGVKFNNGKKPIRLIKRLLETLQDKNYIVLDFFAGSSTTAHATMQLNAEDGGNRKFIMVQLPEEIGENHEAFKAGYKNIAEISKERIRRAGKQILEGECHEDWNKDVGFRVLKVDSSNMKDVYYSPQEISQEKLFNYVDNIKEDRTSEDLLFQVLLESAVELNVPIRRENIQGKEVYFVNDNDLIACFDNDITEELINELATHQPLRVVFRDGGFADNSVKTNVTQIFKQLSEGTEVRSI